MLFTTLSLCGASAQCFATLGKLLSIGYGTRTEDMAIKGKNKLYLCLRKVCGWELVLELTSVGVDDVVVDDVAEACLSTRNTKPKLKQTTENLPKRKRG